MNKKVGFIFLGLGLLFIALFALYNYTDLFKNNVDSESTSNSNTYDGKYDFVKSSDTNSKTKVSFPIFEASLLMSDNVNDFNKVYSNDTENLYIHASTSINDNSLDEYFNSQLLNLEDSYKQYNAVITSETIKCDYLCKRISIRVNNSILEDVLTIYVSSASSEIIEISYHLEKKELSSDFINAVINNIQISHDATYTIGKIENGKMVIEFNLMNKKTINIELDSNKYEEIVDGTNTTTLTTIRNKNTNKDVFIYVKYKNPNLSITEYIDNYFNYNDNENNKTSISINDKTIYKYDFNKMYIYAYFIDENSVYIFESTSSIDIEDFLNIKIKDV